MSQSKGPDTPGDGTPEQAGESGNDRDTDEAANSADGEQPGRKPTRFERRRQKIREEIERNRRGDYTVPTWVLAAILAVVVIGWVLLIVLA
ncbi:MAG TPA: hypothetical protein H9881_07855 [Candidatus Stackebrandtia excrementipullorum]|nr:hypothetical protein [Candidatus Stackebrandtia excrementipullorum]